MSNILFFEPCSQHTGWDGHYSQLQDGDTEALRGLGTCPRPPSYKVEELRLTPNVLNVIYGAHGVFSEFLERAQHVVGAGGAQRSMTWPDATPGLQQLRLDWALRSSGVHVL